jgi:hypothetical protein
MAPIVPGFSSSRSKLERTIKAIADHGARFVGCNVMYLQDGTRTHFLDFIAREFPAMLPRFEKLYQGKYPPEAYRKEVKAMVHVLQERYGMARRETQGSAPLRPLPDGRIAELQEGSRQGQTEVSQLGLPLVERKVGAGRARRLRTPESEFRELPPARESHFRSPRPRSGHRASTAR